MIEVVFKLLVSGMTRDSLTRLEKPDADFKGKFIQFKYNRGQSILNFKQVFIKKNWQKDRVRYEHLNAPTLLLSYVPEIQMC